MDICGSSGRREKKIPVTDARPLPSSEAHSLGASLARVSAVLVREATGVAEPQQNGESGGGLFKAEDRKFALAAESPYQFDYSVKGHLGSQLPAH